VADAARKIVNYSLIIGLYKNVILYYQPVGHKSQWLFNKNGESNLFPEAVTTDYKSMKHKNGVYFTAKASNPIGSLLI